MYYYRSQAMTITSPSTQEITNATNHIPTTFRNSDQLSKNSYPASPKISSSDQRSSRSPSIAEVDEAIASLRSPSPRPTSSSLFANGSRSRLAYYRSSASPTHADNSDYSRRSMSPPSRSPSLFSSLGKQKVTSFPTKVHSHQDKEYTYPSYASPSNIHKANY